MILSDPPARTAIAIVNESGRILRYRRMREALRVGMHAHHEERAVSILLATDEKVRELNRTFRGKDEPTDVLSFPAGEFPGAPLGDIAIAVPIAEKQAKFRRVRLDQELAYLALHGLLHLLGYNHRTDEERETMMLETNRLAVAAGLPADQEWHSIPEASVTTVSPDLHPLTPSFPSGRDSEAFTNQNEEGER